MHGVLSGCPALLSHWPLITVGLNKKAAGLRRTEVGGHSCFCYLIVCFATFIFVLLNALAFEDNEGRSRKFAYKNWKRHDDGI